MNCSLANTKFSKTHLSKMVQIAGFSPLSLFLSFATRLEVLKGKDNKKTEKK